MKLTVRGRTAYAYTGGKAFDAALPAVVFIHGALHDHSVWTLAARWFAHHGHAVLALDLPAHGRSDGPPLESLPDAGAWVLDMLDATGITAAAFVGHSMGSLIALEAASQAPQRATRLVMVGTAYPMSVSPALLKTAEEQPAQAIATVNAFSHSSHAAKPSYPGPGAWLHGANAALMHRMQDGWAGGNLFAHDFQLCNDYAGGLQAAERVTCPTTCVVGRADQMTPPKASRELAVALKARVVMLEAGHALMQEAPDLLLAALRDALGADAPRGSLLN
jgi:pimeloyl-ACP methyl ester carboxylesterase